MCVNSFYATCLVQVGSHPPLPVFLSCVLDETDGNEVEQQFGLIHNSLCHIPFKHNLHTWQSGALLPLIVKKIPPGFS